MDTRIALIRGINVGKAKRIAMAELRDAVAALGYTGVRTLLNSGNVVFGVPPGQRGDPAQRIAACLETELGVSARVIVVDAATLRAVVDENPVDPVTEPSRLLVAFPQAPDQLLKLAPLRDQDWGSAALHVTRRAAYVWCPDGILESPLPDALAKAMRQGVTTRNWATVKKLEAMV